MCNPHALNNLDDKLYFTWVYLVRTIDNCLVGLFLKPKAKHFGGIIGGIDIFRTRKFPYHFLDQKSIKLRLTEHPVRILRSTRTSVALKYHFKSMNCLPHLKGQDSTTPRQKNSYNCSKNG